MAEVKVNVQIVPTSGSIVNKVVNAVVGSPVGEVMKALGYPPSEKFNVEVNGKPAGPDTPLPEGPTLTIRQTEKVRGS